MAAPPVRFKVIAPQRLHTRCWGDQAVVYDDRTGHTHLLGALALEVLEVLQRSPLDRDALLERFDAAERDAVEKVLTKLVDVHICTVSA